MQQSIDEKYGILSVKPVDAPRGTAGTDWHCYVIGQGENRICGYRQGSIGGVTKAVEEIVVRLNERRRGRYGRVHLTMSSPGKKDKSQ